MCMALMCSWVLVALRPHGGTIVVCVHSMHFLESPSSASRLGSMFADLQVSDRTRADNETSGGVKA